MRGTPKVNLDPQGSPPRAHGAAPPSKPRPSGLPPSDWGTPKVNWDPQDSLQALGLHPKVKWNPQGCPQVSGAPPK